MADTEEDKPVFQEEEAMSPPVPAASAKAAAGRGACAGCALRDAQREVWCRICGAVADSADSAGGGADEGGDTRARKGSVLRAGLEDEPWYVNLFLYTSSPTPFYHAYHIHCFSVNLSLIVVDVTTQVLWELGQEGARRHAR